MTLRIQSSKKNTDPDMTYIDLQPPSHTLSIRSEIYPIRIQPSKYTDPDLTFL